MWQRLSSHPEMVYLTDTYPFFFTNTGGTPWGVVFEIDADILEPIKFYPDEDYLVQTAHEIGLTPIDGQNDNEAAIARLTEFREIWQEGLTRLGTCCYRGIVPKTAIRRYCRFSRSCCLSLVMESSLASIDIEAHPTQQEHHQQLLKFMFGDSDLSEARHQDRQKWLADKSIEVVTL
jgi:hypothetical protein